jgi:lipopolysaccharide export system permease protein
MKILRTYILKELFGPFIFSLLVFTFVLLMGNLIKLAELVIAKGVELVAVAKLFLYLIPYLLTYTLPMALLTSILLSFGRLSSDNEVTAMKASGVSLYRIIPSLVIIGIIFSLASIILNDRVLPKAHFASRRTLTEIGVRSPAAYLEPGTFIKSFANYIIFIYGIEGNKLTNVRIYEPQGESKSTRTIVANRGEFVPLVEKKIVKLKLIDGTSDEPDPKVPNKFYKLNFKNYYLTLNLLEQSGSTVEKKPRDMTIIELKNEAKKLRSDNIDPAPLFTEIHRKISLSFASLVFILIGFPLGVIAKREEKSIGFGIALLVILIYYLLLLAGEALALRGILKPHISMWAPDFLLGIAGIFLIWRIVGK